MNANTRAANADGPVVSVLIVSWNTIGLLRKCLSSINELIGVAEYEVIVVDNGSSDGSAAMVTREFPDVLLIQNGDNLGFAKANNQGYAISRGTYCLLLNSDTEASLEAVSGCVEYIDAHDDVSIVGCRLEYPGGAFQGSCFRFPSLRGVILSNLGMSQAFPNSYIFNYDRYGNRQWGEVQEVNCVMGSFMMVRRSALEESCVFDEGYFMYAEETELCWSMLQNNLKVMYFPQFSIVHHWGGSSGRNPVTSAWAYEGVRRGTLRFLWRNRGALRAYVANVIYFVTLIPRAPYWIATDLLRSIRCGQLEFRKSLKLRVFSFHLCALVKPGSMQAPWGAPK